ncbi:MAG: signal transduction histidine kinase/ActR/RegA family two-component response regulator [Hydrogenophaga sp.]|jgi:signal transduction histidine kinase/ActR/RegA family two-component response regulator
MNQRKTVVMSAENNLDAHALRQRAEALQRARHEAKPLSADESVRLLHELQVHQIELELQNEELVARRGELVAALARYTDLYDFAPVAYATLAADGTLVQTNLAGARLLGSPRAQLEGRRLAQFVVVADRRTWQNWLDQVFAGSEPAPCQLRLQAADATHGTPLTVQIGAQRSAGGSECRAVLIDLTERLAAEAAHLALESQLLESQKMEAIGVLAGGIAHDFNNILAAILGNVVLAQEDVGEGHEALISLAQIRQASVRARNLVQQILAFSRRQPVVPTRTALQTPIQETLTLLRATLPAGVQLQASLYEQPLTVLADATQLQQVVMNLCTNAWQALPVEGGRIDVQLNTVLPGMTTDPPPPAGLAGGGYARLRVRDNGSGMDEATQSHVFEPFFTTKPVGSGTGLGLAVVHGIVTSMGGLLSVHSALGQGSSFEVWLPLIDAPTSAGVVPVEPGMPFTSTEGLARHVVCVDDDTLMLQMMERWLTRQGYRVSAYADPQVALQVLRAAPMSVDLVVTDFNMPGMSGLALSQALSALRPDLPIILSSGYMSDGLQRDAHRCGVREVIYKENTVDQLGALLQRLLAPQPG